MQKSEFIPAALPAERFRVYNVPGDNYQVLDLAWDSQRGRIWFAQGGTQSGAKIYSFDPSVFPWTLADNTFDFSTSLDHLVYRHRGRPARGSSCVGKHRRGSWSIRRDALPPLRAFMHTGPGDRSCARSPIQFGPMFMRVRALAEVFGFETLVRCSEPVARGGRVREGPPTGCVIPSDGACGVFGRTPAR